MLRVFVKLRSIWSSSSSSSSDYMAFHNTTSLNKSMLPAAGSGFRPLYFSSSSSFRNELRVGGMARPMQSSRGWVGVYALDRNKNSSSSSSSSDAKKGVPNSNYVVPLDMSSSCITRPLVEILRDLNKRIPDNIVKHEDSLPIPWFLPNQYLYSFSFIIFLSLSSIELGITRGSYG